MHTTTSMLVLVGVIALAGCEEDPITTPRRDTGAAPDAGPSGPLQLEPGMTFTYDAILTFRSEALGQEENSRYTLTITIDSVDDQGVEGMSSLVFSGSGMQILNDNWSETTDFDLWVAQLGPSHPNDAFGAAVTDPLYDPPAKPSPPKELPATGTFFIDTRQIDQVRNAFTEAHQDQQPQTLDPSQTPNDAWVFAWAGLDTFGFNYPPDARRDVRLEYHQKGYLLRLDENAGDANNPPHANCRLTLMSGP